MSTKKKDLNVVISCLIDTVIADRNANVNMPKLFFCFNLHGLID